MQALDSQWQWQLHHWLSKGDMLPQSHSGDEDGRVVLTSLCMYYSPCFVFVKHSVCYEPVPVLINVCILWYIILDDNIG